MSNKKTRATRPEDTLPLDPYKPGTDDDEGEDEAKGFDDGERPTFSCPELDAILAGIEAEYERLLSIYLLTGPQPMGD